MLDHTDSKQATNFTTIYSSMAHWTYPRFKRYLHNWLGLYPMSIIFNAFTETSSWKTFCWTRMKTSSSATLALPGNMR